MLREYLGKIKRVLLPPKAIGRASYACTKLRLGTENGGWTFNPESLTSKSVIYSAGIGEDISFDSALIERFDVTVHGFDPTPRSIQWVRSQHVSNKFVLHEYGIAPKDGELIFYFPENVDHVSLSTVKRARTTGKLVLPVRELSGIMSELGHDHIDLLKLDIEGSEYEVLENLLERRIAVTQLLVEYHHRFPGIGEDRTEASIDLLERNGFRLFNISKSAEEYSFIRI
jgi:FkbM family methyltransferase